MDGPIPHNVKKRLVFYIPGFDPMPPNRYREGYKDEGQKQAAISGYEIDVERISSLGNTPRFQVKSKIDGAKTTSEFRFLTWNDLVHETMNVPIWKSWLAMFKIGRVIAGSGALRRLIKLHFPANITGLYPFFLIPLQIFVGLLLGLLIAAFIPIPFLKWPIALATMLAVAVWWRKNDGKLLPYYVVHDLDYFTQSGGYTPPSLRNRFEELKAQIVEAVKTEYDEILLVGHSSGAHMGVIILAELIREGKISRDNNVALLTLGQAIPMVSYLPKAHDLRLALHEMGTQDVVDWVDFTAPSDGVCFALRDPVSCSVDAPIGQKYPRILSAAFSKTLSPEYTKRLGHRYFRIHFQYLCHFDRPGIYDYFEITSGPSTLWSRYGRMTDSPSTVRINLNKFKDMKA